MIGSDFNDIDDQAESLLKAGGPFREASENIVILFFMFSFFVCVSILFFIGCAPNMETSKQM